MCGSVYACTSFLCVLSTDDCKARGGDGKSDVPLCVALFSRLSRAEPHTDDLQTALQEAQGMRVCACVRVRVCGGVSVLSTIEG